MIQADLAVRLGAVASIVMGAVQAGGVAEDHATVEIRGSGTRCLAKLLEASHSLASAAGDIDVSQAILGADLVEVVSQRTSLGRRSLLCHIEVECSAKSHRKKHRGKEEGLHLDSVPSASASARRVSLSDGSA